MKNLLRRHVLWHLIWFCIVCRCPIKKNTRLLWAKQQLINIVPENPYNFTLILAIEDSMFYLSIALELILILHSFYAVDVIQTRQCLLLHNCFTQSFLRVLITSLLNRCVYQTQCMALFSIS